jgi:hypothetical protein
MFKLLARLFGGGSKRWPDVRDSVLGVMTWDEATKGWQAEVPVAGGVARIHIAGGQRPNDPLVRRGRAIVRDWAGLNERIRAFLEAEIERDGHGPKIAAEIRALEIDWIYLLDPERPDDAVIYFVEEMDTRLWRCDLVGGVPKVLLSDG